MRDLDKFSVKAEIPVGAFLYTVSKGKITSEEGNGILVGQVATELNKLGIDYEIGSIGGLNLVDIFGKHIIIKVV